MSVNLISKIRIDNPQYLINNHRDYLRGLVDDYLLYIEFAKAAESIGDVQAEGFFRKSIAVHRNDHSISNLIYFLVRSQRINEASIIFEEAFNEFGAIPSLVEIACFMTNDDKRKIATSTFDKSIKPSHEYVVSFATCLCSIGNILKALELIDEFIELHPIHKSRYIFSALVRGGVFNTYHFNDLLSTDDFEFSSNVKGGELLFQYWDKLNPPLDVQVLFDLNLEFSDGNFKIFHKADFLKSVNTYFDNQLIKDRIIGYCFHPSAQSDVFRWIQMFSEGGIYLDADMKLLDNSFFYKIKNKNLHFIPWADELQFPCISNWLIKLPAGNKLLSHTLNYIDKFLADDPNIKDSLTMFDITGPGILTHAFVQSYLSGDYSPNFNLVTETSLHAYFSYGSGLDYKKDPDCYWPLLSGTNFKYVDGRLSLMHRI